MVTNRDDFSHKTRNALAMRAGYRCSMTGCGALTIGPSSEGDDKVIGVGVAAHIHAASPGGRRYVADMTPEQRKSIRNGIWLCSTHSVEIDRDDVTYTPDVLRRMKDAHEKTCAEQLNARAGAFNGQDFIAIGPDVVGVGELIGANGQEWTIRISHFVEGDLRSLIAFGERFDSIDRNDRYVLVNALGDGRRLSRGPTWRKDGTSVMLSCQVDQSFPRTDAPRLGRTLATNDANDWFVVNGDLATVSGLDALPQRIKEGLSMMRGESPFHPKAGSRIKEYYDAFAGTPWLQRWVKMEVIRLASIPYQDNVLHSEYTLLQSVLHVDDVCQIGDERTGDWVPFHFSLTVAGVGRWERDISICVPQGDVQLRPLGWGELGPDLTRV